MVNTVGIMATLLTTAAVGAATVSVASATFVDNAREIRTKSTFIPSRDQDNLPQRVRRGLAPELHDGAQDELVYKQVEG